MSAAPLPAGLHWTPATAGSPPAPATAPASAAERKRALEQLLRTRRLQAEAPPLRGEDQRRLPLATGVAELDALLDGGFPRGEQSEIYGPAASGRTGALLALVARTTGTGALAALVDPLDRLDPASARAAGVELSRLLWLRGPSPRGSAGWSSGASGGEEEPPAAALAEATAAVATLVGAGLFGVVALDLAGADRARRLLPASTWLRLGRLVENTATALVLLADGHVACSPGGRALALEPAGLRFSGPPGPARLLRTLAARARAGRHGLRTAELSFAAV